jgi:hypothetical protein
MAEPLPSNFGLHPTFPTAPFLFSGVMSYVTYTFIFSRVGMSYKTGFGLDDWIYCISYFHVLGWLKTGFGLDDWIYCTSYMHTTRNYRWHSPATVLHTFQFTVTHALGFLFFTSRILATDSKAVPLSRQTRLGSSLHCLIPFLPHLQLPILKTRLDSTRLDYCCTRSLILLLLRVSKSKSRSHCDWRSVSQSWCRTQSGAHDQRVFWLHPFITPRHGPHRKHRLLFLRICVYWFVA